MKYAARMAAARLNRTALNKKGEMSTSAILMTTNVTPQMKLIVTRSRCAFNVRDTVPKVAKCDCGRCNRERTYMRCAKAAKNSPV